MEGSYRRGGRSGLLFLVLGSFVVSACEGTFIQPSLCLRGGAYSGKFEEVTKPSDVILRDHKTKVKNPPTELETKVAEKLFEGADIPNLWHAFVKSCPRLTNALLLLLPGIGARNRGEGVGVDRSVHRDERVQENSGTIFPAVLRIRGAMAFSDTGDALPGGSPKVRRGELPSTHGADPAQEDPAQREARTPAPQAEASDEPNTGASLSHKPCPSMHALFHLPFPFARGQNPLLTKLSRTRSPQSFVHKAWLDDIIHPHDICAEHQVRSCRSALSCHVAFGAALARERDSALRSGVFLAGLQPPQRKAHLQHLPGPQGPFSSLPFFPRALRDLSSLLCFPHHSPLCPHPFSTSLPSLSPTSKS
eukprot:3407626-Rhodomonas_salina.1